MRIIFLASKNLVYSNYLLNLLIDSGIFKEEDKILILEQDHVVPNKSKWEGLFQYLKKSGLYYVVMQISKKMLFKAVRFLAQLRKDKTNPHYPYYKKTRKNIKVISPFNRLKSKKRQRFIKKWKPELIISASSMEIIPQSIIDIPKFGVVNVHPSMLPKYQGTAPIIRCLVNKDPEAGVTLYYIDKGIDTGEIIEQRKVNTGDYSTEHSLKMKCIKVGSGMLIDFINKVRKGEKIPTSKQDRSKATYHSIPTKDEIKQLRKNGFGIVRIREFLKSEW